MVGGCCVCSDERDLSENPLVYCDGQVCSIAVHSACYGFVSVSSRRWLCQKCESQERAARVECELCPTKDGAVKKTITNGWVHVVCALYIPEVRFDDVYTMEPIILNLIPQKRFNRTCYICQEQGKAGKSTTGACIKCTKSGCEQQFHVTCAQALGLLCEEAGCCMVNIRFCGYCQHHYSELRKVPNVKTVPPYKPVGSAEHDSSPEKEGEAVREAGKRKSCMMVKPTLLTSSGKAKIHQKAAGKTAKLGFNDLPDHMVEHIFSFLKLPDRKNTRLLSKRYLHLNDSVNLIKNQVTVVQNYENMNSYISKNITKIVNLRVYLHKTWDWHTKPQLRFWKKYGEKLKYVSIICTEWNSTCLFPRLVFDYCDRLQHLEILYKKNEQSACGRYADKCFAQFNWDNINLNHLQTFRISNVDCPEALRRWAYMPAPNLKTFSMKYDYPKFHFSDSNALINNLYHLVKRQGSLAKEITIHAPFKINSFWMRLVGNLGAQLIELNLFRKDNFERWPLSDLLLKVKEKFPNLKKIMLNNVSVNSKSSVDDLILSLPRLTHVCLAEMRTAPICALATLSHLQGLDLTGSSVTDEELKILFRSKINPCITEIKLSATTISDDAVIAMCHNLPNIRLLYLDGCRKLTNLSLQSIFKHCQRLECLSLGRCEMKLLEIDESFNVLKRLVHLDFPGSLKDALNAIRDLSLVDLRTLGLRDDPENYDFGSDDEENHPRYNDYDSEYSDNILRYDKPSPTFVNGVKHLFTSCPSLRYILYNYKESLSRTQSFPSQNAFAYGLCKNLRHIKVDIWGCKWGEVPIFTPNART